MFGRIWAQQVGEVCSNPIPSHPIQSPRIPSQTCSSKKSKISIKVGNVQMIFFQTWLHTRALPVTLPGPQGLRGRGGPWCLKRHHPPGCCSRPHRSSGAGGSQQRPGGAAGAGGWGCHLLEILRVGLPRWTGFHMESWNVEGFFRFGLII